MGITLTHFLSLIVMRCNFLDSIYSSFLPPSLSSSINRMRDLFSNLETVSTNLLREFPDRWIVNTKVVAYSADNILCKLQQLLLGKDAAMASNLPGQNKKLEEVGSSSFSCFATDEFYTSFPSSSEITDEINWIIRILEELLVSGEIKIGYSGVLAYINPGLSEQEVGELLYSSNPSQPWSENYKTLMKPSVLMDVPEYINGFFNPIYNRRLRQASPFTLITSLRLTGLSGFAELPLLPVLHTLRISGCERLHAVSICEKLSVVEALEISCCPELTSLAGLNQLLSLRSLTLSFCFNLQFDLHVQLPPLLEYLDLTHCPSLEEWCQNAGLQNRKLDETIESFQRSSPVGDSPVYGRDNEKNSIIEFLLSDDFNRSNLTVVCIVGESGIGKTSLTHLIYSEERVLDSFDARMFITMTKKSDETRLIKKLIESVTSSPCPMTEADLLEELLIDELSGTKVFIVLDDAENENPCFWNRIVTILNHSTRGSVLLVTTESKDVAEVIGAMKTHYLDPLSDYYCWKIFCQHIFTGLSTNANTYLVETGKRLLSKCQHNPLCIKVLAGFFVCSKNEESWAEILKTDLWDMDGFDGDTLPTLRVGYELLPNKLKKCLHYCSLFPKDYVFAKQQIVCMWMSQGFIFPVEGRQPEEVGLQYFDELLLRGFFQHSPLHDVKEDKFIMHDLICALAINLSRKKGPPAEDDLERIFENCFHFSLNPSKIQMDEMKPLINSDFQSFLALTRFSLQTRINTSILDITSLTDLFTKCINIRTLDLSCTDIVELPSSVGMLKQLRYLCVNNTKIRSIPGALCSSASLQTLEAKDCQHLVELPESVMELTNLRHIDVSKKSGYVKMMIGIGQLTNLQSLAVFYVGCEMPYCSIRELKDLNCLSSCLQIAGLENIIYGLDAKEAALHNKVHLNTLWLHWNDNRTCIESEESVTISEEVLKNLKPNPNIGELIIRNYRGNLFPTWMGDPSFSKLVSIILDKCLNCSQFPALGGLPSLRHLSVQKLYHLVRLENTDSQFVSKNTPKFPSLETLNLWEMYDLEELFETNDSDFPCLRTLSISRCPMLKSIPCFSSLLNLSLYCCVKLPYLPDFPSLKSFRIDGFKKIKSLELPKDLPALKKLEIRHCNELVLVEGLPKLPSLEKLNVVHCPKFDSFKSWKPCHSKSISTTRWFFPKEESTTQVEHEETLNLAEMLIADDTYKGIETHVCLPNRTDKSMLGHSVSKREREPSDEDTNDKQPKADKQPKVDLSAERTDESMLGHSVSKREREPSDEDTNDKQPKADKQPKVDLSAERTDESMLCHSVSKREREPSDEDTNDKQPKADKQPKVDKLNFFTKREQTEKRTSSVRLSVSTSGPEAVLSDGYSWRKYGQKDVLNSKHPRGYYRCTFRHRQNCQATKQVQRSDEDPTIFNVTYHGEHICTQPAAQTDVTHSLGHQLIMPTQNESDKQVMDIAGGSSGQKDVLNAAKYPRGQTVKRTSSVRLSVSTSGPGGTLDDGYRWRKYGQKEFPNAKYPRGYYRCTFRHRQNCQATKQVQRSDEDPTIFNVTYHGEHICTQRAAQTDLTHSLGHQLIMPTQNESDKQVMLDFINPSFPIETRESGHSEQSTTTSLSSTSFGGVFSSGFGSPGVSDVSDSSYFSAFPDEYGVDLEGVSSFDGSESDLNDEYDDDDFR